MIRRVIAGAIAAAALVPLAASAPAAASSGPGCQGASCSVDVSQFIKAYGSGYSSGSINHVPVNQQPPPCLWNPIGDQITGSQYIIANFGDVTPASSLFQVYQSVQQAKQLLKDGGPAGTWYVLPINPAAGAAGAAACVKLPLFAFVQPNQVPPMPKIPPEVFAEFAWNHMKLAAPVVTVSGHGKGFVNLATFVWWRGLPRSRTMWVTAALRDGSQAATVVAQISNVSISTSPAGAGTTFLNGCGNGGSAQPVGNPPATGAGIAPDCGVRWTQPASGAMVTVTVTWQVLFHAGFSHAFTGQPVPGAGNGITTQGNSNPIAVQEIQSINGG
jgi:hypothetical protein